MHRLRQTMDGPMDQKQKCSAQWVLRLSAPRASASLSNPEPLDKGHALGGKVDSASELWPKRWWEKGSLLPIRLQKV